MRFCPLFSGSSGNSLYLEAGDIRLLIDAGHPGKTIENALNCIDVPAQSISAILITHEHSDHVKGAGVLSRRYDLPIYANTKCHLAMERSIGNISVSNTRVFETGRDFYIGELNITPFSTPHDSVDPVGYRFFYKGRTLTVMTDIGHMNDKLLQMASGVDLLLLESNHDVDMLKYGPYPPHLQRRILSNRGHLCNDDAAAALVKLHAHGVRNVVLGHLSAQNNTELLALRTAEEALYHAGLYDEMTIHVAKRDRVSSMYTID